MAVQSEGTGPIQRSRPPAAGQAGRERSAHLLPLLVAVFVAAHAAAAAISLTTDEPGYEFLLHAAITLGVVLSFLAARIGRSFAFLGSLLMIAGFVAYALRVHEGLPLISLLYPLEVITDEEIGLAALVAWFLAGFCFMQSQRENLVFIFVPGLATFGLIGTRNLNPEILVCFMVFMLASVYCWGYDHFLREVAPSRQSINWRRWARAHLSRAALVFSIAGLGGALLGNALYHTTPRLYTGFGFQPRVWNWAGAHVSGYFLFRNGFQIGSGPIHLSPTPVLKVRAEEAQLWRSRTYDQYNGRGWTRSRGITRRIQRVGERTFDVRRLAAPRPASTQFPMPPLPQDQPFVTHPPPGYPRLAGSGSLPGPDQRLSSDPQPPETSNSGREMHPADDRPYSWKFEPLIGRDFRQDMQVIANATAGVLAAPHPYKLRFGPPVGSVDPARTSGLSTDTYGSLQTNMIMEVGQTYTIWSKLPDFTPEQLRAAPPGRYSDEFRDQYVDQASLEVTTELGPIVAEITRNARTDYERAAAIENYLEHRCLYTLNVPRTPRGRDVVVHFVKTSRRGACDMFASAMTLMCRLAGLPTRVATGFKWGTYDKDEDAFIVRGTDAHAWSEVYFPQFGWVPFDPSAARFLESQSLASLLRLGQWGIVARGAGRVLLWGMLIAAGLYLSATALTDPRPFVRARLRRWRDRHHPAQLLAAEFEALLRLFSRRAHLRYEPALTPWQLLGAAEGALLLRRHPRLNEDFRSATRAFYRVRYGRQPSPEWVAQTRREVARLRKTVRRARTPRSLRPK